jgi:hypothetical protein
MVACCTIAYLVAYKSVLAPHDADVARSRIRVCIGSLKQYEDIWPRARKILRELKSIARVLLHAGTASESPNTPNTDLDVMAGRESTLVDMVNIDWLPAFECIVREEGLLYESWPGVQVAGDNTTNQLSC